jgi:hypothetical protein
MTYVSGYRHWNDANCDLRLGFVLEYHGQGSNQVKDQWTNSGGAGVPTIPGQTLGGIGNVGGGNGGSSVMHIFQEPIKGSSGVLCTEYKCPEGSTRKSEKIQCLPARQKIDPNYIPVSNE